MAIAAGLVRHYIRGDEDAVRKLLLDAGIDQPPMLVDGLVALAAALAGAAAHLGGDVDVDDWLDRAILHLRSEDNWPS